MDELIKRLPQLVSQLEKAFGNSPDILDQVRTVRLVRVTFDPDANAGYVYVRSGRELNAVERNIIGVKHGRTVEAPGDVWMNVDLDNFDRLMGIEILSASPGLWALLAELSIQYP